MLVKYTLYLLLCKDNSLYTGITNNLENRLTKHKSGLGCKYVRSRLPFKLIHTENLNSKSEALKREIEIKKWSREKKIKILGLKLSDQS